MAKLVRLMHTLQSTTVGRRCLTSMQPLGDSRRVQIENGLNFQIAALACDSQAEQPRDVVPCRTFPSIELTESFDPEVFTDPPGSPSVGCGSIHQIKESLYKIDY